jgi:putative transposase
MALYLINLRSRFLDAYDRGEGTQEDLSRICGMIHVRTSACYPQSNGKIERCHRSVKSECIRPGVPLSLEDALRLVANYVRHCNDDRMRGAMGYVTPADKLAGREKAIFEARDQTPEAARERTQRAREAIGGVTWRGHCGRLALVLR